MLSCLLQYDNRRIKKNKNIIMTEANMKEVAEDRPLKEEKTEKKKGVGGLLVVAVLLAIVGLGVFFLQGDKGVAAIVNGERISSSAYSKQVREEERGWQFSFEQGALPVPADDPDAQAMIRNGAIQFLIDKSLIVKAAKDAGVEVTKQQIDEVIERYKSEAGSEEKYRSDLKQAGMTEENLRERTKLELTARAFVEKTAPRESLVVSDEEAQNMLEENRQFLGEEMTLQEFKDLYGEELRLGKLDEALGKMLVEMRGQAEIKILVKLPEPKEQQSMPEMTLPQGDEGEAVENAGKEGETEVDTAETTEAVGQ